MQGQSSYDLRTTAPFKGVLLAKRVEVMAKLQRNGHLILMEELNDAEQGNRPQIVEQHSVEVAGYQEELRDIESALHKCEDGTYGCCPDCGQLILLARLEAIPTASRCLPCQVRYKSCNGRIFSKKNGRRATT